MTIKPESPTPIERTLEAVSWILDGTIKLFKLLMLSLKNNRLCLIVFDHIIMGTWKLPDQKHRRQKCGASSMITLNEPLKTKSISTLHLE